MGPSSSVSKDASAKASNLTFSPSYIPVVVFAGRTSGVGQAMAEAFAHQTQGRAHIILVERNTTTAKALLAGFPKPQEADGWTHEYYSRNTYVKELLPLLISAQQKGERARVMSVLGAGCGATIPTDDLGPRRSTIKLLSGAMLMSQKYSSYALR
ncbi:hypothetical protein FB451DRAFT_1401685 [Mycena latifolia]|nr:hypothetical protein FB451DRAFT_1401685 [Mycena latifolia]